MKRFFLFVFIILAFGPLAYFGRGIVEARLQAAAVPAPGSSRVEVALFLFQKYCVPLQSRRYFSSPRGLVRYDLEPGVSRWVEPDSKLTLEYTWNSCSVYDEPQFFDEQEHIVLDGRFRQVVEQDLPELKLDPGIRMDGWDRLLTWVQYPFRDPRRWGVSFWRVQETGPESKTVLKLHLPKIRLMLPPDVYPG